ncbi:hypothetical protein ACE1BS_08935 [Aeromonas jandaei]
MLAMTSPHVVLNWMLKPRFKHLYWHESWTTNIVSASLGVNQAFYKGLIFQTTLYKPPNLASCESPHGDKSTHLMTFPSRLYSQSVQVSGTSFSAIETDSKEAIFCACELNECGLYGWFHLWKDGLTVGTPQHQN